MSYLEVKGKKEFGFGFKDEDLDEEEDVEFGNDFDDESIDKCEWLESMGFDKE